jgi:hypothetical protein
VSNAKPSRFCREVPRGAGTRLFPESCEVRLLVPASAVGYRQLNTAVGSLSESPMARDAALSRRRSGVQFPSGAFGVRVDSTSDRAGVVATCDPVTVAPRVRPSRPVSGDGRQSARSHSGWTAKRECYFDPIGARLTALSISRSTRTATAQTERYFGTTPTLW